MREQVYWVLAVLGVGLWGLGLGTYVTVKAYEPRLVEQAQEWRTRELLLRQRCGTPIVADPELWARYTRQED